MCVWADYQLYGLCAKFYQDDELQDDKLQDDESQDDKLQDDNWLIKRFIKTIFVT